MNITIIGKFEDDKMVGDFKVIRVDEKDQEIYEDLIMSANIYSEALYKGDNNEGKYLKLYFYEGGFKDNKKSGYGTLHAYSG